MQHKPKPLPLFADIRAFLLCAAASPFLIVEDHTPNALSMRWISITHRHTNTCLNLEICYEFQGGIVRSDGVDAVPVGLQATLWEGDIADLVHGGITVERTLGEDEPAHLILGKHDTTNSRVSLFGVVEKLLDAAVNKRGATTIIASRLADVAVMVTHLRPLLDCARTLYAVAQHVPCPPSDPLPPKQPTPPTPPTPAAPSHTGSVNYTGKTKCMFCGALSALSCDCDNGASVKRA